MCKFVLVLTWIFFFFYSFAVKAAPRLFDIFSSKNTAAFTPANTVIIIIIIIITIIIIIIIIIIVIIIIIFVIIIIIIIIIMIIIIIIIIIIVIIIIIIIITITNIIIIIWLKHVPREFVPITYQDTATPHHSFATMFHLACT